MSLTILGGAAVVLFILIGGVLALKAAPKGEAKKAQVEKPANAKEKATFKVEYMRKPVMTATEHRFFQMLTRALPDALIAPQVAMSALVDVIPEHARGKYRDTNRSKISQQRLDYVVMNKSTTEVLMVIELDDKTHDQEEQKAKDTERDRILKSQGYRVERFDARNVPDVAGIRAQLLN